MSDTDKRDQKARELDEKALDEASGGKAPKPGSVWKEGNVTGMDDWEKHNV